MRIVACQWNIAWEDKKTNFQKIELLLQSMGVPGESLIVLPEMFATGFTMNVEAIAEDSSGPTWDFMRNLARKYRSHVMGGIVARGSDGKGLNQAVMLSPHGELVFTYDKIQPFSLGGELNHYEAGSEIVIKDIGGFNVCPFICYDLRFPELFRIAARKSAEIFLVIASWPSKRAHHWVNLLQARAIENQAFVVGVNRSGTDPMHSYPGQTMVIDPHGNVLGDLGADTGCLQVEISLQTVREWRRDFPALRDARPEFQSQG